MDLDLKDRFQELWTRYFAGAELPIVFYYTDTGVADALLRDTPLR